MDRVATLCQKLQEQLNAKATIDQLMLTVQMIQSELTHLKAASPAGISLNMPAINMPTHLDSPVVETTTEAVNKAEQVEEKPEEKTVVMLQVDEAEVEAELEEIKRNAKTRDQISLQNKPHLLFDPVEDIPTLTHQEPLKDKQKELHEAFGEKQTSLNEKLKQAQIELSDTLQEVPVKDLKKAVGLNDRFLYIKELFRGDEVMYERSIKTINSFAIYPEAEYWIKRELKLKLGWNDSNPVVKQFDQLIRRRFISI